MDDAITVRPRGDRGRRPVLHGLSFGVPAGAVTGLLGPSGSGKTTLMRAIVGVQVVRSGDRHRAGAARRLGGPARPGRVRHAGAQRLRRPDRAGERAATSPPSTGDRPRRPMPPSPTSGWPMPPASSSATCPAGSRAGSPSPAPSSAPPRCWSSTSPPSAWTRCCGWSSGNASTPSPRPAPRWSSPATSWTRPARCDRLLLLRDGELLADSTPAELRADGRAPTTWRRRSCAWSSPRRTPAEPPAAANRRARHDRRQHAHATTSAAHRGRPPSGCCASCGTTTARSRCCSSCPSLLLGLLYLLWKDLPTLPGQPGIFDRVGLTMLGIFPFVVMFLVTSIAMLRERTSGTLERLLTTPLSRLDLLLGYGAAFGLAAAAPGRGHRRPWRRPSTTSTSPAPSDLVVLIAVVDARAGCRPGPAGQRLRPQRVPGRAVHAGDRAAAVLPLRAAGAPRADGRLAAGDQRRPAADLRRRGPAGGRRAPRRPPARCGPTSASSPAPPSLALALAAATLRRRTT